MEKSVRGASLIKREAKLVKRSTHFISLIIFELFLFLFFLFTTKCLILMELVVVALVGGGHITGEIVSVR